jgi:predicted SAM-dependent methyltransferase
MIDFRRGWRGWGSTVDWRRIAEEAGNRIKRPLGEYRLQQYLATHEPPHRVNIGTGGTSLDGWLCTDVSWRAHYYLDALKPWPLVASHVYADNVVEHFTLAKGRKFLTNAHTALAEGGRIRLVTPDLKGTCRLYLQDLALGDEHLRRYERQGIPVNHRADLLNVDFYMWGHAYIFDRAALEAELQRAGFENVRRYDPRQSDDPVFRDLEQRTEKTVCLTCLILEADKAVL